METVRYYQRLGLMPLPERPQGSGVSGGIRQYGRADMERLRFIRSAQAAGFTLKQIARLIELDAMTDRTEARQMACPDQRATAGPGVIETACGRMCI